MKINLHVDASISEEHAEIWVKQMKPNLESMLQYLNNNNQVLWCYYDDQLKPISLNDIFIIQTDDRKLDISTQNRHYSCRKPLKEVKAILNNDFIEASRSAYFNFKHIDHLVLLNDGAIDVVLTNQERIAISRRKIKNLKERLGL